MWMVILFLAVTAGVASMGMLAPRVLVDIISDILLRVMFFLFALAALYVAYSAPWKGGAL